MPSVDDSALPPGFAPPAAIDREIAGVSFLAARWTPEALAALAEHVEHGAPALAAAADEALLDAWCETIVDFMPPDGPRWRPLVEPLARLTGLSAPGLEAGVRTVLRGADAAVARDLFETARSGRRGVARPVLVVLASNLPALALQPLLATLALRRPLLVKSASAEPLFTPAFVAALAERSPAIRSGWAALCWRGGDAALERPLLEAADPALVYGRADTLADLGRRAFGRIIAFGPKLSVGFAASDADPERAARGFARDIALFDQRGCLSVQAVYTEGDPGRLADELARSLSRVAGELPPGPVDPATAARVQAERLEADLRGLRRPDLPLEHGTVLIEPDPTLRPSPGLRTVRVHPVAAGALAEALAPWAERIQGVAVAGTRPPGLIRALERLGVSRIAAAGEIQNVDATWHNGGEHPLALLAGDRDANTRE